jgi:probable HAF family extracellular repeat protein
MTVYTSTTFDGPSTHVGDIDARGINDTDQLVGSYRDKDGRNHGYIFDANSGTYTTLDDPFGAGGTFASGINDRGLVVGSYLDADNLSGHYHGFLYNGRTYTTLDDPLGTGSSYAYGINGAGLVVGRYIDHTGTHGFVYNPNGGTYTTLDDPLATNGTQAYGINSSGLIVGTYLVGDTPHGFLYNPSGGTYTTLDDPLAANGFDNPFAASGTVAEGINAAGQIVGYYADSNDDEHGFLYNGGIYTTLDDPQAFDTTAFGINKNGHVVGVRLDKFGDRGFLEIPGPNPPPPAATTTDLILRGANGSPSAGQYEIYDIGNNAILAGYSLAQIGTDWQFAGLGGFFGSDTTDLVLRNVNTGAFEVYDIANNTITSAASLGAVGLDWQLGGFAVDPPTASSASMADSSQAAQLVQAMAGFDGGGSGGADDGLNAAAFGTDTLQQTFLTTPQYA